MQLLERLVRRADVCVMRLFMLGRLIRKVQLLHEISIRKLNLVSADSQGLLFSPRGQLGWVTKVLPPGTHPLGWVSWPSLCPLRINSIHDSGVRGDLAVKGGAAGAGELGKGRGCWQQDGRLVSWLVFLLGLGTCDLRDELSSADERRGSGVWWGWDCTGMKGLAWMFILERVSQTALKYRANWLSASTCLSLKQTSK